MAIEKLKVSFAKGGEISASYLNATAAKINEIIYQLNTGETTQTTTGGGGGSTPSGDYITAAQAAATYVNKTEAARTYLTQSAAASTYVRIDAHDYSLLDKITYNGGYVKTTSGGGVKVSYADTAAVANIANALSDGAAQELEETITQNIASEVSANYLSKTHDDATAYTLTAAGFVTSGNITAGGSVSASSLSVSGASSIGGALKIGTASNAGSLTIYGATTHNGDTKSADFATGMTGAGWKIGNDGAAELDALTLRKFLNVPELKYNRVSAQAGNTWISPACGVVGEYDEDNDLITLKLEDGEIGTFEVGDICMGVYHFASGNETTDDVNNFKFAGFTTIYFIVTAVSGNHNQTIEISPRSGNAKTPAPCMTIVSYGNTTNAKRQASAYFSRDYVRFIAGVNAYDITAANIRLQLGNLDGLAIGGKDFSSYSAYLSNIFMYGSLYQLDEQGEGWKIEDGAISHTSSGLRLTSDGTLYDPNGINIKVAEYGLKSNANLLAPYNWNMAEGAWITRKSGTGTISAESVENPLFGSDTAIVIKPSNLTAFATNYTATSNAGGLLSLENGKTYTFSAWLKTEDKTAITTLSARACYTKNGTTFTTKPATANLSGWADNEWQKVSVSFTIPDDGASYSFGYQFYIKPFVAARAAVRIGAVKLEEGAQATDPLNAGEALARTGIDIEREKITLSADNVEIEGSLGISGLTYRVESEIKPFSDLSRLWSGLYAAEPAWPDDPTKYDYYKCLMTTSDGAVSRQIAYAFNFERLGTLKALKLPTTEAEWEEWRGTGQENDIHFILPVYVPTPYIYAPLCKTTAAAGANSKEIQSVFRGLAVRYLGNTIVIKIPAVEDPTQYGVIGFFASESAGGSSTTCEALRIHRGLFYWATLSGGQTARRIVGSSRYVAAAGTSVVGDGLAEKDVPYFCVYPERVVQYIVLRSTELVCEQNDKYTFIGWDVSLYTENYTITG